MCIQKLGYSYFTQSKYSDNIKNAGLFISGHYLIKVINKIDYSQHEADLCFMMNKSYNFPNLDINHIMIYISNK